MEYGRTPFSASLCAGILLSAFGVSVGVWADAQPDRLAPDFSLPAITDRNETITLSTYRGKAVYLDFWTSWCAPCRESLPLLGELHDQLAGEDFAIVTVNLDTYPADGRRLMNEFGIEYPVASDIAGVAADSFGAETLPAAYVIDGAGVIQPKLPRLNEQSMAEIKTSLLKLIEQERNTRPLVN